jgi:hypothetical protein
MATKDEGEALIGRTDALMKKHRARPKPKSAEAPVQNLDVPVLTEVVDAHPPAPPPLTVDEVVARLQHDILVNLQPDIESLLEERLSQTLTNLLDQVRAGMEAELKLAVRAMVRDAVFAAIDRELLRTPPPKPRS